MDAFNNCLNDQSVKDAVAQSLQNGRNLQVSSTPSFIVNGDSANKISGANYPSLTQQIDAALANQ